MLNYKKAQTASQEQFKSLTSLTKEEFEELLKIFTEVWEEQDNHRGSPEKLASCGDKLFFILFYLKNYPLQEVLGFLFGLDQSQANRWIQVLSQILKRTLERGGYLPARASEQLEERFTKGPPPSDVIIDGVERPVHRPQEEEEQKEKYSGKKKEHTVKNLVLVDENTRQIEYLGATAGGRNHDKKLADESNLTLPAGITLLEDKGFQGYEVEGVCNCQPKKKPRGGELTEDEKQMNSILSGIRIVVEHVIAGIKRCRIVKDIFRNTIEGFDDLVMELVCGLHNFRNKLRNSH